MGKAVTASAAPDLRVLLERAPAMDEVHAALLSAGLGAAGRLLVDGVAVEVAADGAPLDCAGLYDAVANARWEGAADAALRHRASIAIRAAGSERDLGRLLAASRVAAALLALPGALALLDEVGAVFTEAGRAAARLAEAGRVPPLDLWVAVRRFAVADAEGLFIDTLGMAQLGLPDLESYAAEGPDADAVAAWLRKLALYLAQQGAPIRSGDTLDGPDERPVVAREDEATVEPRRPVIRFTPV